MATMTLYLEPAVTDTCSTSVKRPRMSHEDAADLVRVDGIGPVFYANERLEEPTDG